MTEQKNHKVFEFAFEDTPELMIDKYYKATIIRHWEIAKKTETKKSKVV